MHTALTHAYSAHGSDTRAQCTWLSHTSTVHTVLTHKYNAHGLSHTSTTHMGSHEYRAHGSHTRVQCTRLSHTSTVHTALTHEYGAHGSYIQVRCTRLSRVQCTRLSHTSAMHTGSHEYSAHGSDTRVQSTRALTPVLLSELRSVPWRRVYGPTLQHWSMVWRCEISETRFNVHHQGAS